MKEEILLIHCLDTPKNMDVTPTLIDQWHKGPRDLDNGEVRYMGKTYRSREHLPDEYIGSLHISKIIGRGWDRRGYRDMIKFSGELVNLTPSDDDGYISSDEMTWGAAGYNRISIHVGLEGGYIPKGRGRVVPFLDLYTPEQWDSLEMYCKEFVRTHPKGLIGGHYCVSSLKSCPNFDVALYLDYIGIPHKFLHKI